MIIEVADFRVAPEKRGEFQSAMADAVQRVLSKAEGYLGHEILSGLESPERVLLIVRWQTLEAHTVGFRQSPAFAEWRTIIGPYFVQAPLVEHFEAPQTP
ncbi:antibiotic biosynthesis monooxygenase family protein [Ottowia sp.]|uniref:antibiotic biosynthesis monooxygenase family protein n=1 Tax=Ottowia sp. TaxID=1898956 RepID=UPI003A86AC12